MTQSSVTDVLDRLHVAYRLHQHAPVRNAAQAAQAGLGLELDLSMLVKTLVFRTPTGWLLAILRARDQVAYSALARAVSVDRRELRFGTSEELQANFGWEAGGASPITDQPGTSVVVEEAVFAMPRILFGGGIRSLTVEAQPEELFAKLPHRRASFAK